MWKTDGTAAGTVMVADILPGSAGSNPTFFFGSTALGLMFFQADGGQGSELWATDGTAAGTRLVKDINPSTGSFPALVGYGGAVYFAATSDLGRQLWRTDGTAAGTFPVDPVSPGMVNIFPDQIMSVGGVLLYVASDGVSGYELWRSDGTAEGTYVLKDISPGSTSTSASSTISMSEMTSPTSFGRSQLAFPFGRPMGPRPARLR